MEINTQQMEALLHLQEQQSQLPRKQSSPAGGFDALLNQQLATETGAPLAPAVPGVGALYGPLHVDTPETDATVDADTAVLMEAFNQASGTLDLWDTYTTTLGNSHTDTALRDAWGMLQGIDAQMAQMRANPMRSKSPALDSLLNELEVLTTTEKFKFNRGDYIS